jgi:hypothetical protein
MSETLIQQGIQDVIQALSAFADADVVINDWTIYDQSVLDGPYVLIESADEFEARMDTVEPVTLWQERVTLIEPFEDWQTTLNNLRTRRQAILDAFNAVGTARSAGLEATDIAIIRTQGSIDPYYDVYADPDAGPDPAFLQQTLLFECEEY